MPVQIFLAGNKIPLIILFVKKKNNLKLKRMEKKKNLNNHKNRRPIEIKISKKVRLRAKTILHKPLR